jgi:hypothetical protein
MKYESLYENDDIFDRDSASAGGPVKMVCD